MKLWGSLPFEFHIFTTREVLSRAHWPPHVPGYLLLHCRLCNLHRRYRHRRHLWSCILIAIIMIIVRGFCKVLTIASQCFSALYSVLNASQCCLESVRYYYQSRQLFASFTSPPVVCLSKLDRARTRRKIHLAPPRINILSWEELKSERNYNEKRLKYLTIKAAQKDT